MEQFQPEQVRRIWQRVQSGEAYNHRAEVSDGDLCALSAREMASSALYLQLAGRFSGKNAAALRQIAKQEQAHGAILRGICTMNGGQRPVVPAPKRQAVSTEVLLRRCYGQTQQNLAEYEKRVSEPQYGGVFQKLAEQEQSHSRFLLALLGNMKPNKH